MPVKDIEIREAQPADAPAVCAYLTELIAESLPVLVLFDHPPSVEVEERFLRRSLEHASSLFLVALHGDRLVGQLEFSGGWQPGRKHGGSVAMSVHRAWRGRGVGTALLEELFAWVERTPGIARVELEVLANNPDARRLYERSGFRVEGQREAAVLRDGRSLDAILMARLWRERLPSDDDDDDEGL